MGIFRKLSISLWLRSMVFFLVLSFSVVLLFVSGLDAINNNGSMLTGIVLVTLAVVICYLAAAIFLRNTPAQVYKRTQGRTISAILKTLPKLVITYIIYIIVFSVISGLISLLIYYVILAGVPEADRRTPLLALVIVIVILSLPFFSKAFAVFAGSDISFKILLLDSIKMGMPQYVKYLVLGAASFGLAYLIRVLTVGAADPVELILTLVLTSFVIGVAIPLALVIHADSIGDRGANK